MAETKMLVNGKPLSMKEYFDLMKQAKEANNVYKQSDAYKQEQEAKEKQKAEKEKYFEEFVALGKKLKLDSKVVGSIGYKLYLESKDKEE